MYIQRSNLTLEVYERPIAAHQILHTLDIGESLRRNQLFCVCLLLFPSRIENRDFLSFDIKKFLLHDIELQFLLIHFLHRHALTAEDSSLEHHIHVVTCE